MKKAKPYKSMVMRKGKLHCPCRHCDKGGWDSYMLQGDLWRMVLPPDVLPGYSAGFICLRCALESIDRPLCREDITGSMGGFPSLGVSMADDELEIDIRFPKRDSKRKIHAIHISHLPDSIADPIGKIESEYGWLLDRIATQANTVSVRVGGMWDDYRAVTIGIIGL
jgi:hypothetical protein